MVRAENARAGMCLAPTKKAPVLALDFVGAGFIPTRILSFAENDRDDDTHCFPSRRCLGF
jgi:hypothetical protein